MPRKPLTVTRTPPAKPPPKPRKLAGAALKSHETGTCPAPPAPRGNTRTVVHGANSPKLVAPRREAHLRVLQEDYPHLDERRLTLLADRLARIDLLSEWLEKQKSIVYGKQGDVAAAAVLCDK